jgi:tetraacyldisaccharide 4'-kinase
LSALAHYYTELVNGKRRRLRDRLLLLVLRAASFSYAGILRLRALSYRLGLLRSRRLPCPVISVGNIALGGTGKTPTVAWIADYLMRRGRKVAVLSRGYGGSAAGELRVVCDGTAILLPPEEAGDEPCLLAARLPGLIVVIGADRYQSGMLALETLRPDVVLLDDGFQHLKLQRDLNILLLDARNPMAGGWTLPAGMLREPPAAAERADLVLYTRCPEEGPRPDLFPGKPSCWTKHQFSGIVPLAGGEPETLPSAAGCRVMAFAGIADPEAFYAGLEQAGVSLVTTLSFPDHSPYGAAELAAILRLQTASRSTVLLTTQKDAVKLAPYAAALKGCYAVVLELGFQDAGPLEQALDRVMAGR